MSREGNAEMNSCAINMSMFAFLKVDSIGRIFGTVESCRAVREPLQ